jgi:protein RecA
VLNSPKSDRTCGIIYIVEDVQEDTLAKKSKKATATTAGMTSEEKLQLTIDGINKKYGKGAVKRGKEMPPSTSFLTGILPLDIGIFNGKGITRGMQYMVYGPPGVGKTCLTHMIVAAAQREHPDKYAAYVLAEGKWTPEVLKEFGVDEEKTIVHNSDNMEDTLEVVNLMLKNMDEEGPSDLFSVIVVDSTASMVPQSEIERPLSDPVRGTEQSKLLSTFERKMKHNLGDAIVIWVNQIRTDQQTGGYIAPSGHAIRHYCIAMLELRRTGSIAEGTGDDRENVGWRCRLYAKKQSTNRGKPEQTAYFNILRDVGMDQTQYLFELARSLGIITGAGWFTYHPEGGEEVKKHGEAAMKEYLNENPEVCQTILEECCARKFGYPMAPDTLESHKQEEEDAT